MYCESDNASLCWDCDMKVHSANFLAARHSRSLLCQVCQSPTAWTAAGAKLGKTISVCQSCVDGYYHRDEVEESESVNDEVEESVSVNDEDEETDYEDEDEVDEDDLQVVPWSMPPPPISSSSSEDSSNNRRNVSLKRKRMHEADPDIHSDDDSGSSSYHRKIHTSLPAEADGVDEAAAAVVDSYSTKIRKPAKIQRLDRLRAPGCTAVIEFIKRNNRQRMNSGAAIVELCRLSDDSRTVDLESSESS